MNRNLLRDLLRLSPRVRRPFALVGHTVSNGHAFGSLLDKLLREGISIIPLRKFVDDFRDGKLARNACLLTFDDAHRSVAEIAHPECVRRGVPYTIFACGEPSAGGMAPWFARYEVLARRVDAGLLARSWRGLGAQRFHNTTALLSALKCIPLPEVLEGLQRAETAWEVDPGATSRPHYLFGDELARLHDTGLVSIGSHTERHPVLANLGIEEQESEIRRGVESVQRYVPVESALAIPDGWRTSFNRCTRSVLQALEFDAAFTTIERPLSKSDDRLILPRIGIAEPFAEAQLYVKRSLPFLSPRVAKHALRVTHFRLRKRLEAPDP